MTSRLRKLHLVTDVLDEMRLQQFQMNLVSNCISGRELWRVWNYFWMFIASVTQNLLYKLLVLSMTTFSMVLWLSKRTKCLDWVNFLLVKRYYQWISLFCALNGEQVFYQPRIDWKYCCCTWWRWWKGKALVLHVSWNKNPGSWKSEIDWPWEVKCRKTRVMCWRILFYTVLWKELIWFSNNLWFLLVLKIP